MSLFIGTAGWSIPAALKNQFSGSGSQLAQYGERLNTVEINSSFYRPHRQETYRRWADAVPPHFRFSVKMPRSITQERRLKDFDEPLTRFLDEVGGLGNRLGVILVQLPPSLSYDKNVAGKFFSDLRARVTCAIACEPRHASWFTADADAALSRLGVARVAADPPRDPADGKPGGANTLAYYRLHGAPKIYWSAYEDAKLKALTSAFAHSPAKEVWCIFDNTAAGAALADALRLQATL